MFVREDGAKRVREKRKKKWFTFCVTVRAEDPALEFPYPLTQFLFITKPASYVDDNNNDKERKWMWNAKISWNIPIPEFKILSYDSQCDFSNELLSEREH